MSKQADLILKYAAKVQEDNWELADLLREAVAIGNERDLYAAVLQVIASVADRTNASSHEDWLTIYEIATSALNMARGTTELSEKSGAFLTPDRAAWNQTQDAHDGKMYPPDAEKAMENIENAIFDVPWKFKPDWSADEWVRCVRGIVTDRDAEIARLTAALREIYQMAEYAVDEPHLDAERVRDISKVALEPARA